MEQTLDNIVETQNQQRLLNINCKNACSNLEKQVHELFSYIRKETDVPGVEMSPEVINDLYFMGRTLQSLSIFFTHLTKEHEKV